MDASLTQYQADFADSFKAFKSKLCQKEIAVNKTFRKLCMSKQKIMKLCNNFNCDFLFYEFMFKFKQIKNKQNLVLWRLLWKYRISVEHKWELFGRHVTTEETMKSPQHHPEPSPKTDKACDPCDILLIFHNARYVPENIFGMKKIIN